ncbi:MAG TPA: ABC transporter permease [Actinomycetes bacterium]|nr:ABC transporter permease [Actinomycetes bacterium]
MTLRVPAAAETTSGSPLRELVARAPRDVVRLFIGVLVLAGIFSVTYQHAFPTITNLENMSRQAGILLVIAIGQAFPLLIGGFDLSIASTMGLAGTVSALVMLEHGVVAGVFVGLVAATLAGLANGLLIGVLKVDPFIATLGSLTLVSGLANHLSDGASVTGLPTSFANVGASDWGPIPSATGIGIVVLVLAWLVLARSRMGLYTYAIGGSRESCVVAGIPVARYEVAAYTISGLLAGVGGIMVASRVGVGQADVGQGYALLSIATAVIGGVAIGGGVGRLTGVVLGVALLTVITTGMNIAGISSFTQQMLQGAVVVAAVLLNRANKAGRKRRRGSPDATSGRSGVPPPQPVPEPSEG